MYDINSGGGNDTDRVDQVDELKKISGLDDLKLQQAAAGLTILDQAAQKARLNILLLRVRLLYPLNTAGKMRTAKMLEQLSQDNDITLVCYRYPEDTDHDVERTARLCKRLITVPHQETPRNTARFFLELARSFVGALPHAVSRYNNPRLAHVVADIYRQERHDLVVCDFLQSCEGLRELRNVPFVLFEHHIETAVCDQFADNSESIWRRLYLKTQARRLRRYERSQCRRAAHVVACSDVDREILESEFGAEDCSVVPTGVDLNYFKPSSPACLPNNIVFTGAMDSMANQDAVRHFVKDIFPHIRAEIPSVAFTIVGRKPPLEILRLGEQPGIHVTGTVNDIRPYVHGAKIFILPMRVGSGTRVKLLEAMAMGKAIVSTGIGAAGLPLEHGQHIILADEPHAFTREAVSLLRDTGRRLELERSARQLIERDYSWQRVGKVFNEICYRAALQHAAEKGSAA